LIEKVVAGHGRALRLEPGEFLRVTTVEGGQVADFWAFAADDPSEYLSMDHTRSVNSNIFVGVGSRLVSNRRRQLLSLVEDTASCRHDTLLCPCTSEIYRELGIEAPHRSCTANLHEALAEIGLSVPFTPASLNLFMNVPVAADGSVDRVPPPTRAGDSVLLRAEAALVVAVSACPQDVTPINGARCMPTDLQLEVLSAPEGEAPGNA
jgi:uncharacterized protein YcgI (DUF1989 family)